MENQEPSLPKPPVWRVILMLLATALIAGFTFKSLVDAEWVEAALRAAVLLFASVSFRKYVRFHRRWVYRSRIARGECPRCGFDLRASAERCSECGRSIPYPI